LIHTMAMCLQKILSFRFNLLSHDLLYWSIVFFIEVDIHVQMASDLGSRLLRASVGHCNFGCRCS
jgi:hypothetical protein